MFCEAEIATGRIVGLDHGPVRTFKGVPYGATTAGRNRFMPPRTPAGWTGVRECFGYGSSAPQPPIDPNYTYANLLQFNLVASVGGLGEDCLNLDLWSPGSGKGEKKPVIVSLHGGGFTSGSGSLPFYDGAQLATRGDVVVVSVTHRLNVFGYLELAGAGASEDYASAGVAGLLDLVAALEWVRDNIAAFGGDPDNVTLIGQSGGGWKVSCLLAMPQARGLFARAVIQSGSLPRVKTKEDGAALASALLEELGLARVDLARLQDLPWSAILTAAVKIGLPLFEATLDGAVLPQHPIDAIATGRAADIPLIIGTTLDDAAFLCPDPGPTDTDLLAQLEQRYAGKATELLSLYRARRAEKTPQLLIGEVVTDAGFRRFAHAQAEALTANGRASVYAYRWNWPTPAFGGMFGAAHAVDVPAMFHNLHDPLLGAGDPEGVMLADRLSKALIDFATTGQPGTADAPWPPFDSPKRATMIFDWQIGVTNDPDAEIRSFWANMPMADTVFG